LKKQGTATQRPLISPMLPIEYRNVPHSLMVDEPKLTNVELTLSDSEGAFKLLDATAIVFSIDLAEVGDTRQARIDARRSLKNVPSDLDVEQILPSTIEVSLHDKAEESESDIQP
jgi:YbbR-like protein